MLVCLSLLAAACSGGEGDGEEDATSGAGSVIDDVLGTQTVQDFTIHFGLWTLDDDGLVDLYEPLLDRVGTLADAPVDLSGGFTLAPVDGLKARMVDADRGELPTLDVDFGLLAPTVDVLEATRASFLDSVDDQRDDVEEVLSGPAVPEPFLIEIVTADIASERVHVGLEDRSEIDVTFLEDLQPGDEVAMLTLFGQTLPGDPEAERGLDPTELFVYRWNEGLVQVVGTGGPPEPLLDSDIIVLEGSTILSRAQKRQVGIAAGVVARRDAQDAILASLRATRAAAADTAVGTVGEETLTGVGFDVEVAVENCGPVCGRGTYTVAGQGTRFTTTSEHRALGFAGTLLALEVCSRVATALVARNEANRPPGIRLDRFPTLRPLDGGGGGLAGSTVPSAEPDPDAGSESEPEGQPRLSCGEPPDPDEPGPAGGLHGDVRVTTIDGLAYEQQAVGEFLVFENENTVIQMRTERVGESDGLSVATALALSTGDQSISMHAGGRTYVDGEARQLQRGERIRIGDAEAIRGYYGWTIAWPDGQLVKVFDRGDADGMSLTVQPGPSPSPSVGHLGNSDGDPANDLATRGGNPLDLSIVDDAEAFYGTYVDSWRLSQDESLLHYEPGESTDTFLIEGFPFVQLGIEDLDPDDRAEGEAACRAASVVDETLFEGCVVDVAATGNPGYAFDAFRIQLVTAAPDDAAPTDSGVALPPNFEPGDTVVSFGTETLIFGEDPPHQSEGGVAPKWDCQVIDGDLFAEGSIDLADGARYSLSVQYLAAEPRVSLIVQKVTDELSVDHAWVLTNVEHFADAVDTIELDGNTLTATGDLYVNDPPTPGLAPFSQLPAGASLTPFDLRVECGG